MCLCVFICISEKVGLKWDIYFFSGISIGDRVLELGFFGMQDLLTFHNSELRQLGKSSVTPSSRQAGRLKIWAFLRPIWAVDIILSPILLWWSTNHLASGSATVTRTYAPNHRDGFIIFYDTYRWGVWDQYGTAVKKHVGYDLLTDCFALSTCLSSFCFRLLFQWK